MWGASLWVMDSRTPGETEYCMNPDIIKHPSLFINSQYRSLMSVNKPPPGKNKKVHLGFIRYSFSTISGSYQPTSWMTTNQIVYKADPVIQRAK